MKAVMYHYVRPDGGRPPNYYYLDLADFRAQIEHFEEKYGFVDREAFLAACTGEGPVPDDGVVLTFDDGLLDHHEWVLPELITRDLWGIFYVPTGPLVADTVLDIHRIHSLLGACGGETVLSELLPMISKDMILDARREEFRHRTYSRQENSESTTRVKRILNYFVSYNHRAALIDRLIEALTEAAIEPSDLYMNEGHLRDLKNEGMIVGSHSVSHLVFSKLPTEDQRTEIVDSFAHLEDILGDLTVKTFCYPYGGSHTYTAETQRHLEDAGCKFAFDVESRDISAADFDENPQAIPRYDCNEFEYGAPSGTLG